MKASILCIEDHPDNMMLIRRILQSRNCNLIEARNGMQGLAIAENQDVDLLLLDINLPDIDGYEIVRRVRANRNPELARIPIIVVTANAMPGDAQKAHDAGCDRYMSKPIDIQKFMETIESFIPSSVGPPGRS
jgi:two-component system cell cycle response regulator DivK